MFVDFQELFPSKDMLSSHLTIITISNKTNNDMTGWSIEVEEEREQLLDAVSIYFMSSSIISIKWWILFRDIWVKNNGTQILMQIFGLLDQHV